MATAPVTESDHQLFVRELCSVTLVKGTFTLRSGITSDRYFDKYRISARPQLLRLVAEKLTALIERMPTRPELIIAPELGAVPIAAAVALESQIAAAYVRSATRTRGTGRRIEGVIRPGARALLLEDVVTTGSAALEALEAGRSAGLEIHESISILDRNGGGGEALAQAGAPLTSLLTSDDIDDAFERGYTVQEHSNDG